MSGVEHSIVPTGLDTDEGSSTSSDLIARLSGTAAGAIAGYTSATSHGGSGGTFK